MNKVTLSDTLNYVSLSDLYASPKGEAVIYKTHRPDPETNGYIHNAWLRVGNSEKEIPYFIGKIVWEDEGFFLFSSKEGDSTVFIQYALTGKYRVILEVEGVANLIDKTVNGGILFTRETDIEKKKKLETVREDEKSEVLYEYRLRDEDCIVADEFPYWSDERGIINKHRNILFLYENGKIIQVTEDIFDTKNAVYDPYHNEVWIAGGAFTVKAPIKSGLYRINLSDLKTEEIIKTEEKGIWGLTIRNLKVYLFADGIYMYEEESFRKVLDTDLSFGNSIFSDVVYGGGVNLSSYGGKIYFIATNEETSNVWSIDDELNIRQETYGNNVISSFAVTSKGIYWIGLSGLDHQELYLQKDNRKTEITAYNSDRYKDKVLSEPEQISFRDRYGKTIVGWVLRPIDQKEGVRYPAILDIHGGPRGAYGAVYFHEMQYWAAQGYFVLFADPSGGTGRGPEFQKVENGLGGEDYEDLMQFVDIVLETYSEIDENRLGVTGGSYGGFMTNWIIGHTNRFAAAVSQRSTANNVTESAAKDIAPGFIRSMTDPQADDRYERLWESSPLRFIGSNVRTPTLFLHSLNDYRCYHIESVQMYAALQYFNVPTRMVLFKNEHHGLSRDGHPRNRIRRLREITEWMDKYLK